ncbi:hypothetical protein NTGM5_10145 [Candidatus Nitrotoga sp. M5]|nr:hypothetical protein NTGM5_10145 [Candidatus Nitrotoga sp. M5]
MAQRAPSHLSGPNPPALQQQLSCRCHQRLVSLQIEWSCLTTLRRQLVILDFEYHPNRVLISGVFTPAAPTFISTSRGPGWGHEYRHETIAYPSHYDQLAKSPSLQLILRSTIFTSEPNARVIGASFRAS